MNRRTFLGALTCCLASTRTPAAEADRSKSIGKEFAAEDWPAIRAGWAGQPAIVHVWGVTCAPCIEELPRWVRFADRHPTAQIVFLHVDSAPLQKVEASLRRAGYSKGQSWVLHGIADERLRYRIDPNWGGELPRTLLLGADGKIQERFSGSADFAALDRWLVRGRKGS